MTLCRSLQFWGLSAIMLVCMPLWAEEQRDPTVPPGAVGAAGMEGTATQSPLGASGANVIVRNGKPYLVVDTRLVAVGQNIGSAKLERITETEIWLRDGGTLQKLPRFAGIQRSASVVPACGTSAHPATKINKRPATASKKAVSTPPSTPAPAATPCEGAQP